MDPLSIATSVVGLLVGAVKVAGVLHKVKSSLVDAPQSLDNLLSQINELRTCLVAVNQLLTGSYSAPTNRIALIQVDQLVATLTEAVLTFSELEALVTPLGEPSEISIIQRMKWAWNEETISSIMVRLDRHKSSFTLMLNIIQCTTDREAEKSRELLYEVIQQLLQSNHEISRRLHGLELIHDSESTSTTCFRNNRRVEDDHNTKDTSGIEKTPHEFNFGDARDAFQTEGFCFAFEGDLNKSRVYQRTQLYTSDISFASSAVRTHAWSCFSGLSLSEISCLSTIALPVHIDEIFDYEQYRTGVVENTGCSTPTADCPETETSGSATESACVASSGRSFEYEQEQVRNVRRTGRLGFQRPAEGIEHPLLLPQFSWANTPSLPTLSFSDIFHSALTSPDSLVDSVLDDYEVLYLAASLFEFNIGATKREAGYPYLTYQCGEIFDVVAEKGELWLAKNQDDLEGKLGWIWSKHFARVAMS